MQDIEVLRQEQNYKLRYAKDLTEKAEKADRVLTEDELREIGELRADAKKIGEDIKAIEAHEEARRALDAELEANQTSHRRSEPTPITNGGIPGDPENRKPEIEFTRYGKLKAFKGAKAEHRAFASGQWVRANFYGDMSAARWCRENGINTRWYNDHATRGATEGTNSAGGYLVPSVLSQSIIDLREEYGAARQLAKITPMTSDVMEVPRRTGGLTAYFVGEETAPTESNKTWDLVTLTAKKLSVLSLFSSELAEDAVINIGDDLAQEAAYALALKEDQCYFDGDGSATTYGGIQGIVNKFEAGTTLTGYVNAASGVDSLNQVTAADLATLMGTCPKYAHTGAKFVCSQAAYDVIFSRLAISAGGNTIQSISGAYQPSFLGYPIVVAQQMFSNTADAAGNNKVMVMFGNFELASTMGSRRDMRMKISDEYKFAEDQLAIKVTERMDIKIHDIGDTSNAGPVVALIGNT